MSLKSKIILSLNEDSGDKKITNPETGRKIKISTALTYKDENPSLYQKVKNLLAKLKGNKPEEKKPEPEKKKPKPAEVQKRADIDPKIKFKTDAQRRDDAINIKLGVVEAKKHIEDFYNADDDDKVAILMKAPAGDVAKTSFFKQLLHKTKTKDVIALTEKVEGDIEMAVDIDDSDQEQNFTRVRDYLRWVIHEREVAKWEKEENSKIFKEWDLGVEYNITGADGQKLFNEEKDLLQESVAQNEFKKLKNEYDWYDIDDFVDDTKLKGKDLYDCLMLMAEEEMLFDKTEYGNYHDADKPRRGEVTPSEIKFNYKYLLKED